MRCRAARIGAAFGCWLALAACAAAEEEGASALECFTVAQTREKIAQHGLADPAGVLRQTGAEKKGQPLAARLCRNGEVFIYDITVLHRDGRVESVPINAANGKPHHAQGAPAKGER